MLLGSLFLGPRELPWFIVVLLVVVMVDLPLVPHPNRRTAVGVGITFLLALIILLTSFRRSRLGVGGLLGESMLVDLRDRIQMQGVLPPLPAGWGADSELRSAGGTSFAGDFIVAHCHDGRYLDVVVVDVSGKGVQASTRALLLSGALGGLIAAVPAEQLVPAANEYLLARDWEEGFATAAHLSLDLATGDYTIWTAGHPPPVHLTAGSGRWNLVDSSGPVLGLMPDGEFVPASGTMRPGDAMMLYTDGLVETRKFDIGLGIDRLIGVAEQTVRSGYDGAAERLVEVLGSPNDDRALVLIHRV
jgi:serine phosphatase RsbU (regulator of sigma subunit)